MNHINKLSTCTKLNYFIAYAIIKCFIPLKCYIIPNTLSTIIIYLSTNKFKKLLVTTRSVNIVLYTKIFFSAVPLHMLSLKAPFHTFLSISYYDAKNKILSMNTRL